MKSVSKLLLFINLKIIDVMSKLKHTLITNEACITWNYQVAKLWPLLQITEPFVQKSEDTQSLQRTASFINLITKSVWFSVCTHACDIYFICNLTECRAFYIVKATLKRGLRSGKKYQIHCIQCTSYLERFSGRTGVWRELSQFHPLSKLQRKC